MWSQLLAQLVAAVLSVVPVQPVVPDNVVPDGAPCWPPPVDGRVVDPFRPPACPYCAGNRGLEFEVDGPAVVRSSTPGRVTFAGTVAETRYVVVVLANGWRLTYGRADEISVRAGQTVLTGSELARTGDRLFFGLRIDDRYHDPAPYLGELVGRPRLVPADGGAPRPGPPATLRCAAKR